MFTWFKIIHTIILSHIAIAQTQHLPKEPFIQIDKIINYLLENQIQVVAQRILKISHTPVGSTMKVSFPLTNTVMASICLAFIAIYPRRDPHARTTIPMSLPARFSAISLGKDTWVRKIKGSANFQWLARRENLGVQVSMLTKPPCSLDQTLFSAPMVRVKKSVKRKSGVGCKTRTTTTWYGPHVHFS